MAAIVKASAMTAATEIQADDKTFEFEFEIIIYAGFI